MNRDHFSGGTRHLKGRAQTAIGAVAGDAGRQVRGAVDQVAGGAQYAYGTARDRIEDLAEDGRNLAHAARERTDDLIDDGRRIAGEARRHGGRYGRRAVGYAEGNRGTTLLGVAAVAFAAGWLTRRAA